MIEFREGSCDELVYNEVWVEDVYRMAAFPAAKPEQGAIDLGANVGAWTLRALEAGCEHVVAVEPLPDNVTQLRKNLAGFDEQVLIVEAAVVGGIATEMAMTPGDLKYRTISYQAGPMRVLGQATDDEIVVPAININGVLAMRQSWWMLKCDIEGAEHDVFRGASLDYLNRVDYLTMEFHGPGMGQHTAWIGSDWLGALMVKLTEWGSIQTLGAASRGGMIYGWRYGTTAPSMWP